MSVCLLGIVGCTERTAALPRDTQTVDGIAIYIGVIPAELVQGVTPAQSDLGGSHGSLPKFSGAHHLVVALFEATTGARIANASIKAGIGDHSYNHDPEKTLEPMLINGAMTYGNVFFMQGAGPWRIHLEIQRRDVARVSEADFTYEHRPGV